jgi:hypothetical protein
LDRAESRAGQTDLQIPVMEQSAVGDEVGVLACEVAAAFGQLSESYRQYFKVSAQEAAARASEHGSTPDGLQSAMQCPPEQVSYVDLFVLEKSDPALALRRWEQVKEEARRELRSGHRAARALEGTNNYCWDRAQFLALRAELVEAWTPRDAQELQLIDHMAQFQTLVEYWQRALTGWAEIMGGTPARHKRDGELPRVRDAEAVEAAGVMVERFHTLYLRALKALQDRRRAAPPVVVRRAGQVNVATHQINIGGRS